MSIEASAEATGPVIRVYPNALHNHPAETIQADVGQTFEAWLKVNVPSYKASDNPPFTARLNGQEFPVHAWSNYDLRCGDSVDAVISPKDPATIAYIVVAVVSIGYAIYVQNQIPDNYNKTTPDGSSIYSANLQANRPRLMGVVPEIAGRHKHFPDYLNHPRREYINHDQWVYLMLCVGVGEYQLGGSDIFIGDTEINRYTGDIEYTIYQPGESLAAEPANRNFYVSNEVGSTAGGGQGIELEGTLLSGGGSPDSNIRWDMGYWEAPPPGSTPLKDRPANGITMRQRTNPDDTQYFSKRMPFPFPLDSIIEISEGGSNDGDYRVIGKIDGYLGGDNDEIGLVEKLDSNGDVDATWLGFDPVELSAALVDSAAGGGSIDGYGAYKGPFFACPKNEVTQLIVLDFFMARGLGQLEDDGSFSTVSVEIEIQYRAEDATEWETETRTFSGFSNDQQGHSIEVPLVNIMRPEVRVRRITERYESTRIYDTVEWQALRSELETVSAYDGVTTLAVKMRGTNALARSAENKLSVIPTRILPVYENNQWQPSAPTESIDAFFAYAIKSVGHGDEVLELDELQRLRTVWQNRGDTFSAVFDSETTLFPALKRILAPGFAEPILEYGQIIPVRDEPRTTYDHMYQPDNMVGPLKWAGKFRGPDEHDGVEVEFMSSDTWKPETVMCLLGDDLGVNPKKVRAFGVTNRDKAWQYGMRDRRIQRYRRKRYAFTTEMDGLNSTIYSYCALGSDIPGYSQTGRVAAVNARLITLNQPLEWEDGATHFIALRRPDGTLSGPYTCTKASLPEQVLLSMDLDFTPDLTGKQEPPLFQFGTGQRWTMPALITDIKVSGTDRVKLTAVNYDDRVYVDDDNLAPA